MKKRSKRFLELQKKIELKKAYPLEEAVKLAKETSNVNFDASIELHIKLGIDPKKGDQQVRGTVTLPHGTGKTKKIAVFTNNEKEAKDAGADIVGGKELIEKIKKTQKTDFDVAVAAPEIMKELSSIAKILGTRGLMPSPKNETITANIKKTVEELKKGKISFKNDDTGNVHLSVGKTSFNDKKLIENIKTFLEAIKKFKPVSAKGTYIQNVVLTSSMGPGIKIAV